MSTKLRRLKHNVIPDRLDLRDRVYLPGIAAAPPRTLNAVDTVPVPVLDQGSTNACSGFALATVINLLLKRAGREGDHPVSPFMIYSMALRYDEFPGAKDSGSSLRGALKGWYKHGVCRERLWPGERMPAASPVADKDWWLDAALRPLGAYYRIDIRSVSDMHCALNEVGAIFASAYLHEGWTAGFRHSGQRPFILSAGQKNPLLGHAFAIVGYDETGFILKNSWGTKWGSKGTGVITYEDWLDNAMDAWVAQLGVVTHQHRDAAHNVSIGRRSGRHIRVALAANPEIRNHQIEPFIINLENNGRLSGHGQFRTREEDLEDLLRVHFPEARKLWNNPDGRMDVAVYAHGGLTGEKAAAETAARWIQDFYGAGIFPLFLMWESDLPSTLINSVKDLADRPAPVSGLLDRLSDTWNRVVETTLAPIGTPIWSEMKENAALLTRNRASGLQKLFQIIRSGRHPFDITKLRLHLVGHSAGAIVHAHLADYLANTAGLTIESIHFMAPALRRDLFEQLVEPLIKSRKVGRYFQYHLSDHLERADDTCKALLGYRRSLLYLVSESFEHGRQTPILGMETCFSKYLRDAGLDRKQISHFRALSPQTASIHHGDFSTDQKTRRSILGSIHSLQRPS